MIYRKEISKYNFELRITENEFGRISLSIFEGEKEISYIYLYKTTDVSLDNAIISFRKRMEHDHLWGNQRVRFFPRFKIGGGNKIHLNRTHSKELTDWIRSNLLTKQQRREKNINYLL